MTVGKPSKRSKSSNYWTPDLLYEDWCKELKIFPGLDVAADKDNRKCRNYFTWLDDALKQDWVLVNVPTNVTNKTKLIQVVDIWCNPPGDKVQEFVEKATEQWLRWNMNIMMLIPVNTITNKGFEGLWSWMLCTSLIEIHPLFGIRPRFLLKGEEQEFASRNGYVILVFRKR